MKILDQIICWLGDHFNRPPDAGRNRRLAVDVSVIYQSDAHTGIQRVVRGVLANLEPVLADGVEPVLVAATGRHSYRVVSPDFLVQPSRTPLKRMPRLRPLGKGDVFLALDLAAHIQPRHRHQFRSWKRSGCEIAVVVYDLLPIHHPEWFSDSLVRDFRKWVMLHAEHADRFLCISRWVASEVTRFVEDSGIHRKRPPVVSPFMLGADLGSSVPTQGLAERDCEVLALVRQTPTLLSVGTIEPRKGHADILDAFEFQSGNPNPWSLIVVGRAGWKTDAIQVRLRILSESHANLVWLEHASDEMLAELYKSAAGVVAASLDEGFGLPIVEALAHDLPVLARDIPVFRELACHGVHYFQHDDARQLCKAIDAFLADPPQVAAQSLLDAATWPNCAKSIASLLRLERTCLSAT